MKLATLKVPALACAVAIAASGCGGGGGGSPGMQQPANTMPTVSSLASQSIDESGYTEILGFTVGDAETDASQLKVTASSSNTTLISATGVNLGGAGKDRTLIVTPEPGQSGTAHVTLTVMDGAGGSSSTSFDVAVNALYRAEFAPWMRGYVANKDAETKPLGAPIDSGTLADVENITRIKFSDATENDAVAYSDLLPAPEAISPE